MKRFVCISLMSAACAMNTACAMNWDKDFKDFDQKFNREWNQFERDFNHQRQQFQREFDQRSQEFNRGWNEQSQMMGHMNQGMMRPQGKSTPSFGQAFVPPIQTVTPFYGMPTQEEKKVAPRLLPSFKNEDSVPFKKGDDKKPPSGFLSFSASSKGDDDSSSSGDEGDAILLNAVVDEFKKEKVSPVVTTSKAPIRQQTQVLPVHQTQTIDVVKPLRKLPSAPVQSTPKEIHSYKPVETKVISSSHVVSQGAKPLSPMQAHQPNLMKDLLKSKAYQKRQVESKVEKVSTPLHKQEEVLIPALKQERGLRPLPVPPVHQDQQEHHLPTALIGPQQAVQLQQDIFDANMIGLIQVPSYEQDSYYNSHSYTYNYQTNTNAQKLYL